MGQGHSLASGKVSYEVIRTLAAGGIDAIHFYPVGLKFDHPVRVLKITNFTDVNLYISFNGVDTHDVIGANGFCLWDYGSNKADQSGLLEQDLGERVYIKAIGALPTLGAVYVTAIYAAD